MEEPEINLMVVGDILLGAPEAERYFDKVRSTFNRADVVVGQVEWPHTRRGQVCSSDMPAPAADPDHLRAVKNAGFRHRRPSPATTCSTRVPSGSPIP